MSFNQPQPNSESLGYKPEIGDELDDDQLLALLRQCGAKVGPQKRPPVKRVVDLDAMLGTK